MNLNEIAQALRTGIKFQDESGRHKWYYEKNEFRAILSRAADLLESLQAQLAESQRRERAAVDDLYEACKGSPCNNGICVKKNCTGNHIPCDFEWRGPQEAGEGEAE